MMVSTALCVRLCCPLHCVGVIWMDIRILSEEKVCDHSKHGHKQHCRPDEAYPNIFVPSLQPNASDYNKPDQLSSAKDYGLRSRHHAILVQLCLYI